MTRREAIGGVLITGLAALASPLRAQQGGGAAGPRLTGIRRVIIDIDPGNDGRCPALLMGLRTPALHVEAVAVCPGSLGPDYAQ